MCEQNSIFPCVRLNLCDFGYETVNCGTENGFAVAVGREREMGEVGSFFLWFLSRYARKKSFLLSVEGFILIVYIIIIKLKLLLDKK